MQFKTVPWMVTKTLIENVFFSSLKDRSRREFRLLTASNMQGYMLNRKKPERMKTP
jgi:hypothetical protein